MANTVRLADTPPETWNSRDNNHGTLLGDWLGATDSGSLTQGLEIPHGLRHIQQLDEPWELLTMPERRPRVEVFEAIEEKSDAASMLADGFWSISEYNKAGKRNGPLSSETRQNANDVRSVGSCLRCFVMKEHVRWPRLKCLGAELTDCSVILVTHAPIVTKFRGVGSSRNASDRASHRDPTTFCQVSLCATPISPKLTPGH